jgi:signal transduction histidine kinase
VTPHDGAPHPHGSHGHPPWGPGRRRPPWWPKDQPWPPQRREDWLRNRGRFARRAGCAVLVLLLVLGGAGTALVWLLLSVLGVVGSAPFARSLSGAALLLGLVAVLATLNWLRRLAVPGERLVEAARRIESGDYSARVPVRGPGEMRAVARAVNSMSARLEAEEVRRRSVLADMAHELRTPLSIIRGQAEAIADGVYPASPEQMGPILAATRTLEKVVEDLRTVALADAGALHLEREQVSLAVLVHETLEGFRPGAAASGVALVEDVAADLPAVDADPARLSGVVANLVSNALRYTPAGGTVRVGGHLRRSGVVELVVADTGEGIPPDLLARVFDRFVKGAASTGSGLGLAIVRDIVEAHGGSVAIDSTPGAGTTVTLHLPVNPATQEASTGNGLRNAPL